MKIVAFGDQRRVGAWEGDHIVNLNRAYAMALHEFGDSNPEVTALERLGADLEGFIGNGTLALDAAEEAIRYVAVNGTEGGAAERVDDVKLRAPWPRRRIACVGGNFADHLAGITGGTHEEAAQCQRSWPVGLLEGRSAARGPGDEVPYPKRADYLDYEGEVAIVIGKQGKDVRADRIDEYIWGITLLNDLSIRDYEDGARRRVVPMSYNLAKNFDGSTAIGPVILVREDDFVPGNIDVETVSMVKFARTSTPRR